MNYVDSDGQLKKHPTVGEAVDTGYMILEALLKAAINKENYESAAELRDQIKARSYPPFQCRCIVKDL